MIDVYKQHTVLYYNIKTRMFHTARIQNFRFFGNRIRGDIESCDLVVYYDTGYNVIELHNKYCVTPEHIMQISNKLFIELTYG